MIVLDTHAWIWWVAHPERLSNKARQAIEQALKTGEVGVSVISCWEVAMLVAKGRLGLSIDVEEWVTKGLSLSEIRLLELTPEIGVRATRLPGEFHGDPADRFLVATTMAHHAALITKDESIQKYHHCRSVW